MATFQKLPRSRYKVTNFFGGSSTVEGSSVKNPTTRARLQAHATPYKSSPEAQTKTRIANKDIANRQAVQETKAANARKASESSLAASKADALARISARENAARVNKGFTKVSDDMTAKGVRGLSPAKAPVASKSSQGGPARYSKGSTQPPAYKGEAGDKKSSKGAVTSYQKDGYTFTKNSKGVFQNFSAGKTPYKPKGK
jgi:hypothetical protein